MLFETAFVSPKPELNLVPPSAVVVLGEGLFDHSTAVPISKDSTLEEAGERQMVVTLEWI